jgi:PBP1b-binding outer membrane lipoprotein LpoB
MKKIITLIAVAILFASCDKKDEYVYRCKKMIHDEKDCSKMEKYMIRKGIKPNEIEKIKRADFRDNNYLYCDKCFSIEEYKELIKK